MREFSMSHLNRARRNSSSMARPIMIRYSPATTRTFISRAMGLTSIASPNRSDISESRK